MEDAAATLTEETFAFPKHAAMVDRDKLTAFVLGLVKPLHETKIVPIRIGPDALAQVVVYEYVVDTPIFQAILIRSAWLRPIGSMDGARPLKIQVLVDDHLVLDQSIDEHLRTGYPFPVRACSCNRWEKTLECKCVVAPVMVGPADKHFPAVERDELNQAWPERKYGIFAPNETTIKIRVVKLGEGPVDFQARCGITAALYSTRTQDIVV